MSQADVRADPSNEPQPPVAERMAAAMAAFREGRFSDAEAICVAIVAVTPTHYNAVHLLGAIASQAGRDDVAALYFRRAIDIRPGSPEAHGNYGEVLRRKGELDAAAAELTAALRLEKRTQEHYNRLGLVRVDQGRHQEAIAAIQSALALNPAYADAWHNLGFVLEKTGRPRDAIKAFRQAVEIDPSRFDTWHNLGTAQQSVGFFADAAESFRKALALRPNDNTALFNLATNLNHAGKIETIELHRQLAEREPRNERIQTGYASTLIHWGRFADATKVYEAARKRFGDKPEFFFGIAQCRKMTNADRPMIDAMLTLSKNSKLSTDDRGTLHYALGKAFDDRGLYAEAISHFDIANRNWGATRPWNKEAQTAYVDSMIEHFGAGTFAQLGAFADPTSRPIFVVGMLRSGTTLVEQILTRNGKVAAAGEIDFWASQAIHCQKGLGDPQVRARVADLAKGYLATAAQYVSDEPHFVDKMPHNFHCLGLIHGLLPNARIIHCRRHPLDNVLSIYFARLLVNNPYANDRANLVAFRQLYERAIAYWRTVLPADRFLEIDYERLTDAPETEIRKIVAFCGLEWSDAYLKPAENGGASIRTASAWQVRQPMYKSSVERWRNYEPWLGEFRALLPP